MKNTVIGCSGKITAPAKIKGVLGIKTSPLRILMSA